MAPRCDEPELDLELTTLPKPRGGDATATAEASDTGPCCTLPVDALEPSAYGAMVRRVRERLETQERRAGEDRTRARGLFEELMDQPPELREDLVSSDPRFVTYPLADRLLTTAEELVEDTPEAAAERVSLALAVTARLDRVRWGRSLLEDLEARAWALLGEIWAVSGSEDAARTAFRLARVHLEQGSGDPLEEAQVLFHEASLAGSDETGTSRQSLERAGLLFLQNGDLRRLAASLVRKARLAAAAGDNGSAVTLLRESRSLLEEDDAASTHAEIGRLLARSLLAEDRPEEAWAEIGRARSCLRSVDDPEIRARVEARLRALEGRVALAEDLGDEAAACLSQARDALLGVGLPEEAARAHLHLARADRSPSPTGRDATALRRQGSADRIRTDTERLLAAGGLSRETTLALLMVDRAAESGTLNGDLVRVLEDFLERSV